jgi:hypothetical protein
MIFIQIEPIGPKSDLNALIWLKDDISPARGGGLISKEIAVFSGEATT